MRKEVGCEKMAVKYIVLSLEAEYKVITYHELIFFFCFSIGLVLQHEVGLDRAQDQNPQ